MDVTQWLHVFFSYGLRNLLGLQHIQVQQRLNQRFAFCLTAAKYNIQWASCHACKERRPFHAITSLWVRKGRFLLPCVLRRRSAADWLLGAKNRTPLKGWMLVWCVCFSQVAASATDWTLVQASPNMCVCVCVCVCVQFYVFYKAQQWGRLGPIWAAATQKTKINVTYIYMCVCSPTRYTMWS